jgi:uncharacterized protein YecA (UPF0149 family)
MEPRRILVVDDSRAARRNLAMLSLAKGSPEVLPARSIEERIQLDALPFTAAMVAMAALTGGTRRRSRPAGPRPAVPPPPPKPTYHAGRNEKCPCGSGIKFKRCCGR